MLNVTDPAGDDSGPGTYQYPTSGDFQPGAFDLTRFQGLNDDEARVLHRYVNTIQVQRQDFNGRMLTIRHDDLRAIAAAAGLDVDALIRRLDDLQLRKA